MNKLKRAERTRLKEILNELMLLYNITPSEKDRLDIPDLDKKYSENTLPHNYQYIRNFSQKKLFWTSPEILHLFMRDFFKNEKQCVFQGRISDGVSKNAQNPKFHTFLSDIQKVPQN